jgi:hypothetical protein
MRLGGLFCRVRDDSPNIQGAVLLEVVVIVNIYWKHYNGGRSEIARFVDMLNAPTFINAFD